MRDGLPPLELHPRVVNRRLQPRLHAWLEIASSRMHMHNARVATVFKRHQYLVRNANQQTRECATDEANGAIDRHVARARTLIRGYTRRTFSLGLSFFDGPHLKAFLATKIGSLPPPPTLCPPSCRSS